MKIFSKNIVYFFGLLIVLIGCKAKDDFQGLEYAPNMYHSVPYEPLSQITDEDEGAWVSSLDNGVGEYYNSNPLNANRMTMREPAPNTVKRGKGGFQPHNLPYTIPKDSIDLAGRVMKNPLDSTDAIIAEGKILYESYCDHCHGSKGVGADEGSVGDVYGGVTSYKSAAVINKPGGHIFHVITHGKGRMGAHGSQVSVEDRWRIVRYVQKLQRQ
ncbi:MAG: cytochrome c [Bacteroidota bacterium]